MEEEEFNVDIPVLNVFDESDSDEHDTVEESPRCLLSFNDLKLVSNKRMLNDTVVHAAQKMLQLQFPDANGLQDPVLGQTSSFEVFKNRPFQVLHDGNVHCVAVSTLNCNPGEVVLMDSMFHGRVNAKVQQQICAILCCSLDKIVIKALPVVGQQSNGVDCGIFAIAFIEHLLRTKKYPTEVNFDIKHLRNHLLKCFKDNIILPFPLSEKRTRKNHAKELELEIYCSCRMVWLPSDANIFGK